VENIKGGKTASRLQNTAIERGKTALINELWASLKNDIAVKIKADHLL